MTEKRPSLHERLDSFEGIIESILSSIDGLKEDLGLFEIHEIRSLLRGVRNDIQESSPILKENITRLNNMINEFKGVIAMSRSSLKSGCPVDHVEILSALNHFDCKIDSLTSYISASFPKQKPSLWLRFKKLFS